MRIRFPILSVLLGFVLAICGQFAPSTRIYASSPLPVQPPVLKWKGGGCYKTWCEMSSFSSPAVADLDNDGKQEVIGSGESIFVLDGTTGALKWRVNSGHDRSEPAATNTAGFTRPGIVIADVDTDGAPEIVTAHREGYVSVYDRSGYFKPGWPQRPSAEGLEGLAVYDLNGDGKLEIIVTSPTHSYLNTWVFAPDASLYSGWPQSTNVDICHAWGVFSDGLSVGDLDRDGTGEIVVPSDVRYVCAYKQYGSQLQANAIYSGLGWGAISTWESLATETQLGGSCDAGDARAQRYTANFELGGAAAADVDGNGSVEVVVTGDIYDCAVGRYPSRYETAFIFNADRSRFKSGAFDWSSPPIDVGAPLSEDSGIIRVIRPSPALADLDGDGRQEILFPAFDGRLHAFWLDKTEHGHWPYSVYSPAEGIYRFASEPVVADLNSDGHAEVIFTSWPQNHCNCVGKLHILDYLGNLLYERDLPPAYTKDWNGASAPPTLADIDGDQELEVVVNTIWSGLVAYDLPGTAGARIMWGTGRGNYQRTGSPLPGPLQWSHQGVSSVLPGRGGVISYSLRLETPSMTLAHVRVTDTLPVDVHYVGNLSASSGAWGQTTDPVQAGRTILTWYGSVSAWQPVSISFGVSVSEQITSTSTFRNVALLNDGMGNVRRSDFTVVVNGHLLYLPFIRKN